MSEGDFDYSNQFRVAVERSGKSVTQLAKESGVSTFTWYGLIRGQRAPRLDTLLLAMETLGYTSLDKLLGIN